MYQDLQKTYETKYRIYYQWYKCDKLNGLNILIEQLD